MVALFLIPLFLLPWQTFEVGDNIVSAFYSSGIESENVIWSLELGLLCQTATLSISEYYTSHAFKPVKTIA